MKFFYNTIIQFYGFCIWIASSFNKKAAQWIAGRTGLKKKIAEYDFSNDKWIWFHCSSFGEFNDGKTLIDDVKQQFPGYKILLTFFSPSVYEVIKVYKNVDLILYMPLDTRQNAKFFLDRIKPNLIFFIRNDVWPNYVSGAKSRNIPTFLISFQLTSGSKFLKFPQRNFYKSIFQKYSAVFTQESLTSELLGKNNFSNSLVVSGNTRIDRIYKTYSDGLELSIIEKFISGKFCFIAGSTLERDKKVVVETFFKLNNLDAKWLIVPHEIKGSETDELKKTFGQDLICYSEIEKMRGDEKILLIDNVGMLSKLYKYADVAIIGGGFDRIGIHSILEPAVFGCPVCFGPNHRKLNEAIEMMNHGGAVIIKNADELKNFILSFYKKRENLAIVKEKNSNYIFKNTGATKRIIDYLKVKEYFS